MKTTIKIKEVIERLEANLRLADDFMKDKSFSNAELFLNRAGKIYDALQVLLDDEQKKHYDIQKYWMVIENARIDVKVEMQIKLKGVA